MSGDREIRKTTMKEDYETLRRRKGEGMREREWYHERKMGTWEAKRPVEWRD